MWHHLLKLDLDKLIAVYPLKWMLYPTKSIINSVLLCINTVGIYQLINKKSFKIHKNKKQFSERFSTIFIFYIENHFERDLSSFKA